MPRRTSCPKARRKPLYTGPEPDPKYQYDDLARRLVADGKCPASIIDSSRRPPGERGDRDDRDGR